MKREALSILSTGYSHASFDDSEKALSKPFLLLYKNIHDCIYRNQEGYDSYDMMTSYGMVARDHCEIRSPLWIKIHSTRLS